MTTSDSKDVGEEHSDTQATDRLRDQYCSLLQRSLTRFEMESERSYHTVQAGGASWSWPCDSWCSEHLAET